MKMIPITEFTDRLWYEAYLTVYNRDLAFHMGVDPSLIANPPTLTEFYENIYSKVEDGKGYGWAILKGDEYLGHVILDKRSGEWEIGTVLKDPKLWSSGVGAKATIRAIKWIFEEDDNEWVIAYTQGKDPRVKEMLMRGGFREFMNFLVLDKPTWEARWAGRVNNG